MIGIPATAGALSAGQAVAQGATSQNGLKATVKSSHVALGQDVVVTGSAPSSDAGQTVELEYAGAGQRSWTELTSSTIGGDGRYRLAAPVRHSGLVFVRAPASTSTLIGNAQADTASASPSEHISVAPSLRLRPRSITVLGSRSVNIDGRLLPGVAGRKVRLEARTGGGWQVLSTARTGSRGAFDLVYAAGSPGRQQLRVRFVGDRLNSRTIAPAGQLSVFGQSVASWYDDAGSTACGFHAYYGVANLSLPCGTQVAFLSGGRSVTATVDDRGPYVSGREWDLNQNTAAALGFDGVGTVWSSQ